MIKITPLSLLAAMTTAAVASAQTINIEATSLARQNGAFKQFDNFTGTDAQGAWRSGYEFNTSGITQDATEVRFELQYYTYSSSAAAETIQFFDSGWRPGSDTANAANFDDLGNGVSYGSFAVSAGLASTDIISFTLNAAALNDFNANLGDPFRIGAVLTSVDGTGISGVEGAFRNSDPAGVQRLVVVVPEPATMGLLSAGVVGLLGRRRRQRSSTNVQR